MKLRMKRKRMMKIWELIWNKVKKSSSHFVLRIKIRFLKIYKITCEIHLHICLKTLETLVDYLQTWKKAWEEINLDPM